MSSIYIQEPPTSGKVLLDTSVGDIDVELWSKEAPKACRNFLQLCMEGYYDNAIFHRIVKGFIAQTGDPSGTGYGGESSFGKPFKDEFHQRLRFNRRGLVGMANSGPNDNRSQFFFTLDKAPELDKKHTIFAKVGGNTIYNMIRLNDIEVGENDRPMEPPKVFRTEILFNPFDDIEPRQEKKSKEARDDDKERKKASKRGPKNFKLLSFGEEAEEDDDEVTEISKSIKIKSSHDASGGKSDTAQPVTNKVLSELEDTEIAKIREKLSKKEEVKQPEKDISSDDEDSKKKERREKLKREAFELKRELAGKKRKKDETETQSKKSEFVEEKSLEAANDLALQLKEEKKQFIMKKKETSILKRGGSRESETLALLAGFQDRLETTKVKPATGEPFVTDEIESSDVDWMAHSLKFENYELKAKDANIRDEDTFDIYDPRNPINKRRRETTKGKSRRKKEQETF